ncbi:ABC transporter permease [Alicyclobacillus pomorum]|jgi:ABC-type dipeptide/oligopeptide/nickel transport system permease subunit|uniref:ABC transporter permease n=1 Tax=Alicyclobacillus pomorum TaxID=204470 RepID=UPI00040DA7C0|nr:ABC transporter permease [Alicyclobacillus pomorum]
MALKMEELEDRQTRTYQILSQRRSTFALRWFRFRKNRLAVVGLVLVVLLVVAAVFAPIVAPYSYTKPNFLETFKGPSARHWFGTDSLGRDVFSRVIWALRSACIVGFGAEAVELTVGLMIGALAGYLGGLVDNILMRIVDIVYAFPSFLFSIILVMLLGHNIWAILIAVSATSWVGMARVVRGQVMRLKQSGFIESARSMGAGNWRIIRRYLLPNSMGPVLVAVTFGIPANMMTEAGLSVVGLGIEPPTPDLGQMIIDGQQAMFSYPYLMWTPALLFAITLISFTFVGDGMRDAFDMKGKR